MIECMIADYSDGLTISQISEKYKVSAGKVYYMLRDAGCAFTHKRRKPVSDEERQRMSAAHRGWKMSERQKQEISARQSCNYNGLNGYGHTKLHNRGYVLAYAPLHPHAHRDGYVMLHTVIMEQSIGRYLEKDEVVHHLNHDRKDNRLENLQLMNKHDHFSMHMKERHEKRRNDLLTA